MKSALVSTEYWGAISFFSEIIKYDQVILESKESFIKQSYRNRTYVDGPNGILMLNLSVNHASPRQIDRIEINQQEKWGQKHWQALQTSYGSSPFFEAIAADIETLYNTPHQRLWDLNLHSFQLVCKWLRIQPQLKFTKEWFPENNEAIDLRTRFHPKKKPDLTMPPYSQVFDHKTGFKENLSILDLICNEGPAAYDYLKQL